MTAASQTIRLEEALSDLIDYRGKSPPKSSTGTPVISAKVVKAGRILRPIEQTIDPDYYQTWMTRGYPRPGDVVMTTEGPLGEVAQLDDETAKFAIAQRVVVLRGKPGVLDNTFLKFLLISPLQQSILASFATGTTVEGISQKSLRSLPIRLPPYSEQCAIAEVLGTIDAKLELNRRMNGTLEAMARAIFKDWFIDFGPTRAKMEGRAPYLAPDIWALFPGSLDSDGKPKGWASRTLGDIARQVGESVRPESLDPNTPYIGLEHMPRRSIALSDWDGAGKVTSGKLIFRKGDFLFGKLRPYFHKVGIAPVDGICSTDIIVLNAREPESSAFVLTCISQDEFVAFADRTSDGTKMPRTSWGRVERYSLCLPNSGALEAFNACVVPMLDRIVSNVHESRTLAATRDLLLPKLISGDVLVQAAEKTIGSAK
ncbi:restriction endonuclease subunit S [Sphingomonas histidinilytica]|uniref:restriction endonuclease subunit S n=1 Tax=Rhizorhabdus histidinilytica TaxID=439228 RepID=UPI001ADB0D89|nr:restriction endonuclease subunit S [Rhizorhabdus histidinilytica]MBO9379639.1 restriction endonuclease subunit S [Rhizorhabdus histidinilytica]